MAQAPKTPQSRLTPPPKVLQKALLQSAQQAQRLADAFGVKVPAQTQNASRCAAFRLKNQSFLSLLAQASSALMADLIHERGAEIMRFGRAW